MNAPKFQRKRILARKCPPYIYDNRTAVELNLQSIDADLNIWYDFPISQAKTDYCKVCNLKLLSMLENIGIILTPFATEKPL